MDSPTPDFSAELPPLPRVTLLTMMRLGLFQMGLGMMSVLLFGLLNRVLIKDVICRACSDLVWTAFRYEADLWAVSHLVCAVWGH
jgi:hypothetical protein